MYQSRTYQSWVEDKSLFSFRVKLGESDLFIRADKALAAFARESLDRQRRLIQDYIRVDPDFATSLAPYSVGAEAPDIVREMAEASSCAGVGPMAAVAGAIAEYVAKDLLKASSEVIVENGGDIFMRTNHTRRVGIFAGESVYSGKIALEIAPQAPCGICTSSGTVGPSLSFGKSDAAVVICNSAILADAWATRLGNMVKSASCVDETLTFVKDRAPVAGIKGVVLIIGEKIGAWGEVKLVQSRH
ncbi:MAG: UPF0280 family protein [Candidatus Omnitrophota bacterium]|nr:MAG: UPF0280 family protein [Candidatus Omnitrophota bacterium]